MLILMMMMCWWVENQCSSTLISAKRCGRGAGNRQSMWHKWMVPAEFQLTAEPSYCRRGLQNLYNYLWLGKTNKANFFFYGDTVILNAAVYILVEKYTPSSLKKWYFCPSRVILPYVCFYSHTLLVFIFSLLCKYLAHLLSSSSLSFILTPPSITLLDASFPQKRG